MTSPERQGPVSADSNSTAPALPSTGSTMHRSPVRRRDARNDPRVIAAVSLGGALGAPVRYCIAQLVDITSGTFPWGTFWINVSGSFAVGFVLVVVLESFPSTRYIRPFVATGFLGAYTTYSTFVVETDLLIKNRHWSIALSYLAASLATGLLAVWIGMVLARTVPKFRSNRHAT